MATTKNAMAMCDQCSFLYPHRVMKLSSYKTLVCQTCFDGAFDLKNHPQNKIPDVRDDITIKNPRPDTGGRNLEWQQASFDWDDSSVRFWANV